MRGLDNYVAAFYFSLGLLLPLVVCEWVIFCANERKVRSLFFVTFIPPLSPLL